MGYDTPMALYLDDAERLYLQTPPYEVQERLGYDVYLFDATFITLLRAAMTTDCINTMTAEQLDLMDEWMACESGYAAPTAAAVALSTHLANLVSGGVNPSAQDCPAN